MNQLTRRHVIASAPALAVTATGPALAGPPPADAELIALGQRVAELEHVVRTTPAAQLSDERLTAICEEQDRLIERILTLRAVTAHGVRAKAQAVDLYLSCGPLDNDPEWLAGLTTEQRLVRSLIADALALS